MARKDVIDLLKPFKDKKQRTGKPAAFSVTAKVRGQLKIDTRVAKDSPLTVANVLAKVIRGELEASHLGVKEITRERRRQAMLTPQENRYPQGRQPNPSGPYGDDSGWLKDNIKANLAAGKSAFVGIPKERAKAAFVLRRVSKTARGESETSAAIDKVLNKLVDKMVIT